MKELEKREGIAQFEKVSYEEFKKSYIKLFQGYNEKELQYNKISLGLITMYNNHKNNNNNYYHY